MDKKIILKQEHQATKSKVFLASMEDSHIKHLIKLAQDPSLVDLMGWNTNFELDDTEQFIEAISSYYCLDCRKSQPLIFGIYLNPQDLPIGYVLLKGFNLDLLFAEIAVAILDPKYRKKGYGKLALKRMISYAFDELHLKIIGAAILLSNKSSINMCENIGLIVKETTYDSWAMPNGDLADVVFMELKNQE